LPIASVRAMAALAMVGSMGTACSHHAGLSPGPRDSATTFGATDAGCAPASASGVRAGVGTRRVVVMAGRVVMLQLVEPEAYASSMSGAPPSAFPWLPGQSSDTAGLRSVPLCARPPVIMSLPFRLYPFRAITPGRYQITARLNTAHHVPHMHPSLPALHRVHVTVVVQAADSRGPTSSPPLYTPLRRPCCTDPAWPRHARA
jgi:hypothetical protein